MARVSNAQIEQLIHAYCVKEHPEIDECLEVEFDRRPSERTFRARVHGGKVKLSFHVAPSDPEFKTWLTRARRAASHIMHGKLVGSSLICEEISGRQRRTA